MLNIAITFDYELFLGENYLSDDEILFSPTRRLEELLDSHGITSTFFADVCSVFAHKKYGLNQYVNSFEDQLRELMKHGHDVQLHLHPNWLLSEYRNEKWIFDTTHYRLHDFGFDSCDLTVPGIIHMGKEYLEKIIFPVSSDYKCIAYRAGGYSVQPHEKLFKALLDEGILIDSSVCAKQHIDSNSNQYDFRNIPESLNWWISPNHDFFYKSLPMTGIFEVPIPADKNNLVRRVLCRNYATPVKNSKLNGAYAKCDVKEKNKKKNGLLRKIINYGKQYTFLTFDQINSARMISAIKRMKNKEKQFNTYIAIICHPKLVDDGVLRNMNLVISAFESDPDVKFVNMNDIYKEITGQKNLYGRK